VRDLFVDRQRLFNDLKRAKAWVPIDGTYDLGAGPPMSQELRRALPAQPLHRCGCCLEACPQYTPANHFVGAAVISQVRRFNDHPIGKAMKSERLEVLMEEGGVADCGKAGNCAEVCPKEIPLLESIAAVQRRPRCTRSNASSRSKYLITAETQRARSDHLRALCVSALNHSSFHVDNPLPDRSYGDCMLRFTRHGFREMLIGTVAFAIGATALGFTGWWWVAIIFVPVLIFLFAFFRDPERHVTAEQHAMVSPATAKSPDITEVEHDELLGGPAVRIGIFLSVFQRPREPRPVRRQGAVDRLQEGQIHQRDEAQRGVDRQRVQHRRHRRRRRPASRSRWSKQIVGLIARRSSSRRRKASSSTAANDRHDQVRQPHGALDPQVARPAGEGADRRHRPRRRRRDRRPRQADPHRCGPGRRLGVRAPSPAARRRLSLPRGIRDFTPLPSREAKRRGISE
jgi:hypothetical protein